MYVDYYEKLKCKFKSLFNILTEMHVHFIYCIINIQYSYGAILLIFIHCIMHYPSLQNKNDKKNYIKFPPKI